MLGRSRDVAEAADASGPSCAPRRTTAEADDAGVSCFETLAGRIGDAGLLAAVGSACRAALRLVHHGCCADERAGEPRVTHRAQGLLYVGFQVRWLALLRKYHALAHPEPPR